MQKSRGEKSLVTAYICWFVGGIFGLHHFYLGRDKHAFITFSTFGGYFTLGLIRDLWRLPEYVKDANNDLRYLDWLHKQMKAHKRPPSSIVRQSGLMIVSNIFAHLVDYAVPTLGVWLTGNVGRHQGSIKSPLIAAYLAIIPSIILNMSLPTLSPIAATFVFNRYSKEWRIERERSKPLIKRVLVFTLCSLLYLSLYSSYYYFGCSIDDPETSEPIKCGVAFKNFLSSQAYTHFSESVWMVIEQIRQQGIINIWKEIMQEFDVSGKTTALSKLGLDEDATPQEILAAYKKLSREYHPDREKDESKKSEKHEKFIEVQEAYRKLKHKVERYKLQKEQEEARGAEEELRDEL